MTSLLYSRGIRIFDYAQLAEPLRGRIRTRAQEVCDAAGLEIEHVSKSHIRKEELVQRVLASRGDAPGPVHGAASVKVYDKFGRVLRIETTVNDVSFFKHHRMSHGLWRAHPRVEHKDGHSTRELAALKKSIYSLIDPREIAGVQPALFGLSGQSG